MSAMTSRVPLFILIATLWPLSAEPQEGRRRPGSKRQVESVEEKAQEPVRESETILNRWDMLYQGKWYDPYNQNILKGDLPIFGSQESPWFLELGITSDSFFEYRKSPVPVSIFGAVTQRPDSQGFFGDPDQFVYAQSFAFLLSLYQGNTSFKPPNFDFRIQPVFNFNYARLGEYGLLRANPMSGNSRSDYHLGFQELSAEFHLIDLSERYDFLAMRLGIQPFNADFRGFVYFSAEPGARLFGNYADNKWQYNLAFFRRLDKETNSGLNSLFDDRQENVIVANLYRQDFPVLGHTLQGVGIYRFDLSSEGPDVYDKNGFLVRPTSIGDQRRKDVHTAYLGVNGDGHFGRWNVSESFYFVMGKETHNPIAGREVRICAWMAALEISYDIDWFRVKGSAFWASGDRDPNDDKGTGFDGIVDQPNFAGGEFSYWQRQGLPFIAGGVTNLNNRLSLLPNLRPGKEQGQNNFVNPGVQIFHLGIDIEILPQLKMLNNYSFIRLDDSAVIEQLRQDGSISQNLGYDLSTGFLYRPFLNNNVQFKLGGALFIPEDGFANLFGSELYFQTFTNLIFTY